MPTDFDPLSATYTTPLAGSKDTGPGVKPAAPLVRQVLVFNVYGPIRPPVSTSGSSRQNPLPALPAQWCRKGLPVVGLTPVPLRMTPLDGALTPVPTLAPVVWALKNTAGNSKVS